MRNKEEVHNFREQGMRLEALGEDTAWQRPVYEPGKNSIRRFSCCLLGRLRSLLRLWQLPIPAARQ